MKKLVNIAAGLGIAGAIGVATLLALAPVTANAAPPSPVAQAGFAEWGPTAGVPRPRPVGSAAAAAAARLGYGYGGWNDYATARLRRASAARWGSSTVCA